MITAQYHSPIGIITLVSDGNSLTELRLAQPLIQDPSNNKNLQVFEETCRWLDQYFSGKNPDFTPSLNPQGSLFQQKVWRELLTIPYGQTTTYGAIAKHINCRSAQAVGQAIHRNPIAIIIPCHRVIGADGSLTGYASGLDIKQQLLTIEKALLLG
jgi:methylated-DNA-[protein]-cysteine S-methyltransferase